MSEVESNALTGAEAAPAPEENAQAVPETPAPSETDAQKDEHERDDKGRFAPAQKRINELTREKYEARRYAETQAKEVQQLRAEIDRFTRQQNAPDPNVNPEAWIEHLVDERAGRVLEQRESQWAQQQEQQRFNSMAEQYASKEQAYAAAHPDYSEAVDQLISVVGHNPALAEVLMTSEHGAAVAHYLGLNLDEAAKVASLPPHLAAAHVARLEARVSAKPKPVTGAPAPPSMVGGASTTLAKDPARQTDAEWFAANSR